MRGRDHKYLPYGRQFIDEDDIQAVVEVLRGDWLTTGPMVGKFEHKLRDLVESRYVTSCSSGTAALHLACMALGLGPSHRVIVPAISFLATANAALFCGADVLFCDVDPSNGLMRERDVLDLIKTLSPNELDSVAAILPVNLTGEVAEIEAIAGIARERGWKIIIDSCHALGTTYRDRDGGNRRAGDCHFADMEVFSFHAVKTIATGEGGAVTTNDEMLHDRLCLLRNHGMERDPEKWQVAPGEESGPWYYEMQLLGYNYRLSDIHCALGLSQLDKLSSFIDKRRGLVAKYDGLLAGLCPHITPLAPGRECEAARHLYVILIDFAALGTSRLEFVKNLADRNVGTQLHYIPIHTQPFYVEKYGALTLPGAEHYYARALSLPLHVSMSEDDVVYVVEQIGDIIRGLP